MSENGFRATLKITDNGFRIPDNLRQWYSSVLKDCKLKNNGYATITINRPRRIRSTGKKSQSHHFNGHCQQIAACTGQPFGDVKSYLKHLAISTGYPILKDDTGNPIINLWGQEQGISETESTVEECSLLIEQAHQLAAELGIRLQEK